MRRFPSSPRGSQSRHSFPATTTHRGKVKNLIQSDAHELNLNAHGDSSIDWLHDEHEDEAGDGGEERDPLVVVLEAGSPAGRLCVARVEAGQVHQTISSQEEIGGKNT